MSGVGMPQHALLNTWWLCPNRPPCPHGAALHDIDDWDDDSPTCCAEGCRCGRRVSHRDRAETP